jgi:hypothetical protein
MPHNQEQANHALHAIVTLLVFGLWIPIWIWAAVRKRPAKCVQCGTEKMPR